MKRRTFLAGLLATPLLSTMWPSSSVAYPTGYTSGSKTNPKQFLFVVEKYNDANAIYNCMGRPRNVKVVSMGSSICGYRADFVVMDDKVNEPSPYRRLVPQWVNEQVRTRLTPTGQMDTVKFVVQDFDWGTKTGVAAEFIPEPQPLTGNEESLAFFYARRQAVRFHKPRLAMSPHDYHKAKASLFTWYMEAHL